MCKATNAAPAAIQIQLLLSHSIVLLIIVHDRRLQSVLAET